MRYILNIIIISLFFVFGESKGQTSFHSKEVVYMLNDEKIKGEIRIENRVMSDNVFFYYYRFGFSGEFDKKYWSLP